MRLQPLFVCCVCVVASQVFGGGNALVNFSFEAGLDGWTTDKGAIRKNDPPPHCGVNYLMGGIAAASSYTYQTVSIADLGFDASDVDSGHASVDYGGWQAGWGVQEDRGKIEIVFLDESQAEISRADLGWFFSNKIWTLLSGTIQLPPGTRAVTYGFHAERAEGSNNDGYLDDAFLSPVVGGGGCYADFTGDGALDLFDFLAFVNAFNAADDLANCNQDCTLDLFDFLCFTNAFNAGC